MTSADAVTPEIERAASWAEFNAAAAWCAERGLVGRHCAILPAGLSDRAQHLIYKFTNTFRDQVLEFAIGRGAMPMEAQNNTGERT